MAETNKLFCSNSQCSEIKACKTFLSNLRFIKEENVCIERHICKRHVPIFCIHQLLSTERNYK